MREEAAARVKGIMDGFFSLFYPSPCACCGRYIKDFIGMYICASCYNAISPIPAVSCVKCGKPLDTAALEECGECGVYKKLFSVVRQAGLYEKGLKELVWLLKFSGKKEAARVLAKLIMNSKAAALFEGAGLIVPVPMAEQARRERGYNHTELLASILSGQTSVKMSRCLVKVRETAPQNSLERRERIMNLKRAFKAIKPVNGFVVVVVDDVYTTGATMNEAARALLEAGAKEVRGAAAARAV
ncbi:MAG TPA: ComF family protein [bacterium]|nr:ComF family protein [bacterium]